MLFTTCVVALAASKAYAGSVEFVTYYPAPYGVYDRLRLMPRAALAEPCDPGSMYVNDTTNALQFCASDGTWGVIPDLLWAKVGSNLYPVDNTVDVGIGTTAPATPLDIAKDVAPSSGATNLLTLRAYDIDGATNSANGDGAAINFKNRSNGFVIDIGRISAILTQTGNPTYSALTFSNYALPDTFLETMRIENNKVGVGTTTPEFRLTLDKGAGNPDGGILAIGTFGAGDTLTTTGAGTRLIWYPKKAAFRVGGVSGTQWDDTVANPNIGDYSIAMGYNPKASSIYSIALGEGAEATNSYAIAIGRTARATGIDTIAIGYTTTADAGIALGGSTATVTVDGIDSIALGGHGVTVGATKATAMGYYTNADSTCFWAAGRYNVPSPSGDEYGWKPTLPLDPIDPLFAVGNGNGIVGDPNRYRNALTVLKNGSVGIGTAAPGNKLHVTGGTIKATGGLILETRTTAPTSPVNGQFWLCTDTGDVTPCNDI